MAAPIGRRRFVVVDDHTDHYHDETDTSVDHLDEVGGGFDVESVDQDATAAVGERDRFVVARSRAANWVRWRLRVLEVHAGSVDRYWWRISKQAPRGVWVIVCWVAAWVADDTKNARLVRDIATDKETSSGKTGMQWGKEHSTRIVVRSVILLFGLAVVAAFVLTGAGRGWLAASVGWEGLALIVVVGPLLLGWLGLEGSPSDVLETVDAERLAAGSGLLPDGHAIVGAFERSGWSAMTKAVRARDRAVEAVKAGKADRALVIHPVRLLAGPDSDQWGDGLTAMVTLPDEIPGGGVALTKRKQAGDDIAQSLGLAPGTVTLFQHLGDPNDSVRCHVGSSPLRERLVPWVHADDVKLDYYRPVVIGRDVIGAPVAADLTSSMLLCGEAGSGKSAALQVIATAAALDPSVTLHTFWKAGVDGPPFIPRADTYGTGATLDESAYRLLKVLRRLAREARARGGRLAEINNPDVFMEGSTPTRKLLAANPWMAPHILLIDEFQDFTIHAEYGKEIAELIDELARQGRSASITLVLGTQQPEVKILSSPAKAQLQVRFCFNVDSHIGRDAALGALDGAHPEMLTKDDKGVCWGKLADGARLFRWAWLRNRATIDPIIARSVAARSTHTFSPWIVSDNDDVPARKADIAGACRDALVSRETGGAHEGFEPRKSWRSSELAAWLAQDAPDAFAEIDARSVTAALKAAGLTAKQVSRKAGHRADPENVPLNSTGFAAADIRSLDLDTDQTTSPTSPQDSIDGRGGRVVPIRVVDSADEGWPETLIDGGQNQPAHPGREGFS